MASPHACPLARSASVHVTGSQSGANMTRPLTLDPVRARLIDVQEERLLDGMLVRPGLDEDTLVEADVRRSQHIFPWCRSRRRCGAAARSLPSSRWCRRGHRTSGEVQPLRRDRAVVEPDLLRHPAAERRADEPAVLFRLGGEVVHVIQPAHADAAARVGLSLILQRGPQVTGGPVPLGLPVELKLVPVRITEQVGRADSGIAVLPANAQPGGLDLSDPALQRHRAGARSPVRPIPEAGGGRQLQAVMLVVIPGAQVDRSPLVPFCVRPSTSVKKRRLFSGSGVSSSAWLRWATS